MVLHSLPRVWFAALAIGSLAGCGLVGESRYYRPAASTTLDASVTDSSLDASVADSSLVTTDIPKPLVDEGTERDAPTATDVRSVDSDAARDVSYVYDAPNIPADVPDPCPLGLVRCRERCFDLNSDVANCGGCGVMCPGSANAVPVCMGGACRQQCVRPFENCDMRADNGCETALNTHSNCGACMASCQPAAPTCIPVGRNFACAVLCPEPLSNCNGSCVDTQTDLSNCGGCMNGCTDRGANLSPACTGGACAPQCNPGWGNCDMNLANGCETALVTLQNCGACGNSCMNALGANQLRSCEVGRCVAVCRPGFADCDRNADNGCEIEVASDPRNCRMCGNVCPSPPIGAAACARGTCTQCGALSSFCQHAGGANGPAACCPLAGRFTCNTILAPACTPL